jgi:hypothetical protein
MMAQKTRRPQAPKTRSWVAKQVRDLDGPYRPKVERDRSKVRRKEKYPRRYEDE